MNKILIFAILSIVQVITAMDQQETCKHAFDVFKRSKVQYSQQQVQEIAQKLFRQAPLMTRREFIQRLRPLPSMGHQHSTGFPLSIIKQLWTEYVHLHQIGANVITYLVGPPESDDKCQNFESLSPTPRSSLYCLTADGKPIVRFNDYFEENRIRLHSVLLYQIYHGKKIRKLLPDQIKKYTQIMEAERESGLTCIFIGKVCNQHESHWFNDIVISTPETVTCICDIPELIINGSGQQEQNKIRSFIELLKLNWIPYASLKDAMNTLARKTWGTKAILD